MKRLIETLLVVAAAPLWVPLAALAALAVVAFDGRPAFFRQERAGLLGRPFWMVKLRTMRPGGGGDAARLTRLGRILRASSLDELPQLAHVVTGKMALVGPRPLPVRYLPRYTAEQARRHEVRPGLTGWAQVNGRNALTWEEKFRLDVWYVENRTLLLDAKILALTIVKAISREGINHPGSATMDEFRGA